MLNWIITIIVGFIAFSFGILAGMILQVVFRRRSSYSGVMKIIREDEKLVYSLELKEDPMYLEGLSEVVFKVETSDQSSDRK